MNFDDIVWLPLYFFVYLRFSPVSLLLVLYRCVFFRSSRLFQYLYGLFIFKKYILCKFLAYIFAISAYEASNAGMSVQMCYKTIFACSFFCFGWSARRIRSFDNNKNFERRKKKRPSTTTNDDGKRLYLRAERLLDEFTAQMISRRAEYRLHLHSSKL